MHLSRIGSVVALAAVLAALPACGSATGEPAASASSAMTRAPLAAAVQAKGPEKVFAESFAEVPLSADQRTQLEQLFADAQARHEPIRKARADATEALAAQVESGTVDRAALTPKFDAVAAAWATAQAGDRAAFEKAHALLAADQRAAFVTAFQAQLAAKHEGHEGRHMGMGGMKKWADDLQLTDDQRAKIKDAMRAEFASEHQGAVAGLAVAGQQGSPEVMREAMKEHHGDMKARMDRILEAFKSDHFVMDEVAPKEDPTSRGHEMGGRMLKMAEVAVPILTPDQRTLAAKLLREHATTEAAE